VAYGLKKEISETFLSSQFRIIEIYKELKLTDKIKEKQLCNASELSQYLISKQTDPFLKMKTPSIASTDVDYKIAELICTLSKRKIISDVDFLVKEFNVNFVTNYVGFRLIFAFKIF
jgi:hypothetical protein